MTFDLYIPFLLVKHHNFSTKKSLSPTTFSTKKTQVEVENMTKNRTKVYMYISGHLGIFAATSVTGNHWGPVGEFVEAKLPERRDLFPEFWVYVEQLRLLRSLGVTGAGSCAGRQGQNR